MKISSFASSIALATASQYLAPATHQRQRLDERTGTKAS
ncbi:unnamed protein product [Ixodes pacificus]